MILKMIMTVLFTFGVNSEANAVSTITDPITGSQLIRGVQAPRYLYHWTTFEKLAEIAGEKSYSKNWENFTDYSVPGKPRRTIFFPNWPQFRTNPPGALFTWTQPILGMKGGEFEDYGNVLIQIEIDVAKARAAKVISKYALSDGQHSFQSPLDVSGIDIVDHGFEWVILNPQVIKTFTADINVLRPMFKRELELLKDPNHRYDSKDIHSIDFKAGGYRDGAYLKHAIDIVSSLIETNPEAIPSWFRREVDGRSVQAEWISGPQALQFSIPAEKERRYQVFRSTEYINGVYRGQVESSRKALAELDLNSKNDIKQMTSELTMRTAVYASEHPGTVHLCKLVSQLGFAAIRKFEKFPFTADTKIMKGMRESFDPYRSILEVMLSLGKDSLYMDDFSKLLANAPDIDLFREAWTRYWPNPPYGTEWSRWDELLKKQVPSCDRVLTQ